MENIIKNTDVTIVGAGPCGITAAIYCARAGLSVSLLESFAPGGQVATTSKIENYPGFETIDGVELAMKFVSQLQAVGVSVEYTAVRKIKNIAAGDIQIVTDSGIYASKAVICASGAKRRLLGIDGEQEFTGSGVSYCAVCDGNFFKGKTVAVVGGGNTAIEDALYLSGLCTSVYLIHRRSSFRASVHETNKLEIQSNISLVLDSTVMKISGSGKVESISVKNLKNNTMSDILLDGVFIAVGTVPVTDYLPDDVQLSDSGYVIADAHGMTSLPGIFAAGDLRDGNMKQIITAAADGALAADGVRVYIENLK